ncbi:MAG TPA: VOC family protein [Acidimicrobiales bacterium]
MTVFNHVGLCVADLDRSRRFYTELLGFTFERELRPPDEFTARLVRVAAPVNMTAAYLVRDGLVLELLHFGRPDNPPRPERVMNEPGLTHLSLSVDDVAELLTRVPDYGGEVLDDTNLGGLAVMIRDPDGQLIEILPMSYRDSLGG